jgi:catechol 2,3-dioxygenase-like lactoylglutathione lyase family enzyme
MIRGGNATLYVSDMDRAVRFYVETLGFKLRARTGADWAEVDAGEGLVLELLAARDGGPKPGTAGSIRVGLELNQPIDEVVAVLKNRGVVFQGDIRVEGGVKQAPFTDPDGNALCLTERRGL